MVDIERSPDDVRAHEIAERIISERIRQARKEEALQVYEELLKGIWDRIVPTLGRVTVAAMLDRSIALTSERHPLVALLKVGPDGPTCEDLRDQLGDEDFIQIRDALKEVIANLIELLALLTGDILVRQLIQEVERKR